MNESGGGHGGGGGGEGRELLESIRHMRKRWPREKQRLGGHRARWLQLDQKD